MTLCQRQIPSWQYDALHMEAIDCLMSDDVIARGQVCNETHTERETHWHSQKQWLWFYLEGQEVIVRTQMCCMFTRCVSFCQVSYVEGTALVMGFEDPMVRTDDTPVKRCLQTKWPYIELLWTTERSPSLN